MKITKEMEDMRYVKNMSFYKIGEILGKHESTIRYSFNKKFGKTSKSKIEQPTKQGQPVGIERKEIKIKHDPYSKMIMLFNTFIDNMKKGFLYEENEIKKACKVGKNIDSWNDITDISKYIKYQGFTEKGIRLWGLEFDQIWAESNHGIMGYRRRKTK